MTAREGALEPQWASLQAGGSRGVWDHVHVHGVCVSVCEMQAGERSHTTELLPCPLRAAWAQAPRSGADGHGASVPFQHGPRPALLPPSLEHVHPL